MPFSIAQWISQSNGHSDRLHGAVIHDINTTAPVTDNCGSTANTLRAFDSTDPV